VKPAALFCAAAVALAAILSRFPQERLPQAVRGEGALAVAFGDARAAISSAMMRKADGYFHGGAEAECGRLGEHHHHHGHHHDGEEADCGDGHGKDGSAGGGLFDPWAWINAHVRAPDVHRHLEGSDSVEMLPWFWASVKADPHNIDAWTTAWYVAHNMMKDEELSKRVIGEARANNPDSVEIALYAGRQLYDTANPDLDAAAKAFAAARDLALSKCGGDLSKLSEDERRMHGFALGYLEKIAERR